MKNKSGIGVILKFIPILLSFSSCDFTSSSHKDILNAQQKFKEQKFEESAWYYERVLQKSLPRIVRTKIEYQLADIYTIYLKNYAKALLHFDQVLEVSNEPLWKVRSLEKKATIYFNYLENFQKAGSLYSTLMSFRPKLAKFDEYEYLKAQSLINQNDFNQALKVLESIRNNKNHEFYTKSFFEMGLIYFYQQKWQLSINYWYEYIKREPIKENVIEAKFMMANAYESKEDLRRAYNIYSAIKDDYPNTQIIESRLESLFNRRVVRKR